MNQRYTNLQPLNLRTLSFASIILGIAGGVFWWWVPLGMVVSISGLTTGFIDWANARRHSRDYRMSIVGLVISAATLGLDIVIALLGWQLVTFGSLR
jgi:hypothetical protein